MYKYSWATLLKDCLRLFFVHCEKTFEEASTNRTIKIDVISQQLTYGFVATVYILHDLVLSCFLFYDPIDSMFIILRRFDSKTNGS